MDQQPSTLNDQNARTEATRPSTGSEAQAGGAGERLTRRRFTRAGLAAPVILTLANRPAFGAICTVSGFTSYSPNNPSGVRHVVSGCGGYSPGAWKKPDAGNGDGSRSQWIAAGYHPNPRPDTSDPAGTTFDAVFGTSSGYGTLHDVLKNRPGSLEFHAVAALLNAGYMGSTYGLTTADVIGLYWLEALDVPYTTASGSVIQPGDIDVKAFFEQTYH